MARYLLDSDAIIDYFAAFPGTVALLDELMERGDTLCVCDVVIAEVYSGIAPKDRQDADLYLDSLEFVATSRASARVAGEWRYAFARQGIKLPTTDAIVAATAREDAATVITGNARHFPMPEVSLLLLPRP